MAFNGSCNVGTSQQEPATIAQKGTRQTIGAVGPTARTREALIRCCRDSGEINLAAVAALRTLPERIEPPSKRDRPLNEVITLKAATEAETPVFAASALLPQTPNRLLIWRVYGKAAKALASSTESKTAELPPPEPPEPPTPASSHIPDRQWHPIGTLNIKELGDIAGPIPDCLRRGEVPS